MAPREKWTDERLDDLNKKVGDGFGRVEGQIKDLRGEMNSRFDRVDARFDSVNERFDALNRNLVGGLFVVVAAMIGSNFF
ncbi:MAG: hypothetical protein M3335_02890 [Actinomycetota bacterium]|nr:hypothetical protein [Actinomycetota bacterium]